MAASNYKDCRVIDSIAESLHSRARALRNIDQLSIQIAVARCRGQNDEMLRLTLERADLEPQTSSLRLSAAAAALWAAKTTPRLTADMRAVRRSFMAILLIGTAI